MSVEQDNKATVRRWIEIVMGGDLQAFYEVLAPDCVFHMVVGDISPDQYRKGIEAVYKSIDLFHGTIEDIFAEGDKVATRGTWGGIHKGELRGVPPTGNEITMTQNVIYRLADNKIVDIWAEQNELHLLQQLGAIPGGVSNEVNNEYQGIRR